MAAAGQARAETIQLISEGDLSVTRDVINADPIAVDLTSQTGNITVDIGQANITNNGSSSGYAVGGLTLAADTLLSISVDEVTATGTGRIFGVIGQAVGGGAVVIDTGSIEATGTGGYGIWGASQNGGSITINSGSVTTTGGVRNPGTAEPRPSYGIWAKTDSGDVSITSQSVVTTGVAAGAVHVDNVSGDVVVDSDYVSTAGDLAPGISATGHNVTITSGEAVTSGNGAPGIYVPTATGDVTITSDLVTTSGGPMTVGENTYVAAGIAVVDGENVAITSGEITTSGGGGFGIAVSGVTTATVDSGIITTTGNAASGITVDGVTGNIAINSDSISTSGESVVFGDEIIAAEAIYASGDGDITIDSGLVNTEGQFAHGILVEGNVGNVIVTSGQLSTEGDSAQGILVTTTSGDITIDAGTTTTSGGYLYDGNPDEYYSDAVTAISGSGDISITSESATADGLYGTAIAAVAYDGGDIYIDSGSASGAGNGGSVLFADATSAHDGAVTIYSDSIVNDGDGKGSLTAIGSGDVFVESGSIVSTGTQFHDAFYDTTAYSSGLLARSYHGNVVVSSGSVSTVGDLARGVTAIADEGDVTVTSGSVTTQSARGIQVRAAGEINIDSTSVHSAVPPGGQGAHGIMVTAGAGDVNILSDEIVTEGARSHGIYVANANGEDISGIGSWRAATGGAGALTITSGTIDSSAWGMMIDHQGAIDITSAAITSAGSGIYLYGGDAITIASGTIETQNGPGIVAWGDDGAVDISSDSVVVGTGGDVGVFAKTTTGDILIHAGDTTTTATGLNFGNTADAVGAVSQSGDITIVSGTTSTQGYAATGIYAFTDGAISVTSGTVMSAGDGGNGVFVGGNGPITVDSGDIHASGDNYEGAILVVAGEGDVSIDSDLIEATGAHSHGIVVPLDGQGPTFGNHAATGGTGALTINSGSIDVTGVGIFADHVGDMAITSGAITSGGPGIYVYGGGLIDIDSGSIDAQGPGIVAWGGEGLVDITSGDVLVGETGDVGIFAKTTTGDIVIHADTTTTTATGLVNGISADGVGGISQTGDITIVAGSTSTQGYATSGVYAFTDGTISVTSGSVTSGDAAANGIFVGGNGAITIDSGEVHASADNYEGAILVVAGEGDVVVDSDVIEATGAHSHGIVIGLDGEGPTFGDHAASGGTGQLTVNSGSIDVTDVGIFVDHVGDMSITSGAINSGGPGIYVYGGGLIDIDSTSIETQAGPGIVAWGGEGDLDITSGHVLVGENGDVGVYGQSTSGDIVIHAGDTTTTVTGLPESGYVANAVGAISDTGDITIVSDAATTQGLYSTGIMALTGGDVSITSGSVANTGDLGNGIYVEAGGAVTVDSGSIELSGDAAWGLYVDAFGPVSVTSQSVVNTGALVDESQAFGIAVGSNADVVIDSGTVSTTGDQAFGIGVTAEGDVTVTSDSVSTTGVDAFGIGIADAVNATVTAGDISVTGEGELAAALAVSASAAVDITLTGNVSSAHSYGVAVEAGSTITVNVAEGATLYGATGAMGVMTDTDTTLTIGGHLSSDVDATVQLAGGDDVVNLVTGANIEGGLYGGEGLDTLNLDSTVNEGVGVGQSIGDMVDFEALNVLNGFWTLGGDHTLDVNFTGGTLAITGTLTDDAVIGEGATLQIGVGGETGDLIGDLQVDGTVIFNRSNEYDFGGDIWGAGSLVKEGDSLLILSGAYDFTGTTVVNGGTIKILQLPSTAEVVVDNGVLDLSGQDQELASLSGGSGGQVNVDGGSLTVNQGGSTEFGGEITGDGSLTLTGGGRLNLTGDNTYTGPTTIDEGTLAVNGGITSNVTVNEGGTLGGSGDIEGDVFVGEGGSVGPGNSPGTLTVDGDFTFASGSTYAAEVEADGAHDQIDVSGETTIEDDVTLMVLAGNGDYARLSTYTLLTSDGGLTGEFDNVTTNLAFLDPHVTYTATEVVLNLTRNDVTFASFALNQNQENIANVLEDAGFGDPLYDAVVVQSAQGSQEAYAELSGELYASMSTVLLQQARYGREAILDRAAHAPEGRGAWGELIGSQLEVEETLDHVRVESDGRGFVAGADMSANGWRAGVALTHLKSDVDAASLGSTSDVKSTSVSAYAGTQAGPFKATVGASYTRHEVDATRSIAFTGFTDTTTADFDGTGAEIFGELSLSTQAGGVFLEPFVGLAYSTLSLDGFDEQGGDAALSVDEVERSITTASIGVRASGKFETGLGTVTPHASVALQGVSGDEDALLDAAFQGAGGYTIAGATAEDGVAFGIGVRLDRGRLGLSASYSGVDGDEWSDDKVEVGVSFRF